MLHFYMSHKTIPSLSVIATILYQQHVFFFLYADHPNEIESKIQQALTIRDSLRKTTDEVKYLMKGLEGDFIPPGLGGDLLRDGAGVLPTGRNIHALDPYRMPSAGIYASTYKLEV